ncbi:hypothetical protein TanjilG_10644 [Lupinus angustifolius]|uniref:Uncharacterized protein n=1 Tax=Lupinus angustifolius TaxID=3871 RepID=A0A1J7GVV0_LUPAN|nr:hypothetical protein TanjilG_10644 [Lupinus angustifolius]
MAGAVSGELSHHGSSEGDSYRSSKDKLGEAIGCWYMSRKEIEENSPSRIDGIDLKKETYLRKSYCTILQDLGMRLKVFWLPGLLVLEVSNQMLELYEQNKIPPSQGSEVEGSAAGGGSRAAAKAPAANEEQASKQMFSHSAPQQSSDENHVAPSKGMQNQSNEESAEMGSDITDHKVELDIKESQNPEHLPHEDNKRDVDNRSKSGNEQIVAGDQDRMVGTKEGAEVGRRDDAASHKSSFTFGRNLELREGQLGQSPIEAIKMIDRDKVKAAMEKRRKERAEMTLKKDIIDEDDLIEMELEDGVELAVEDEKNKGEGRQDWSKLELDHGKDHKETKDGKNMGIKGQLQKYIDADNAKEGEMIDDASSMLNNCKRKIGRPPARQPEMKKRHDSSYHNVLADEGNRKEGAGYAERE